MLDHMSDGRLILGLGRGTGKVEFDGFRVSMDESRAAVQRERPSAPRGLETGVMEYHGEFVDQPRVALRPQPFKSFNGRTYSATVSPESARIMAELGTGVLIVPQKPWRPGATRADAYRATYREANGDEPPPPIVRRLDVLRRERRPRRGDGRPLHRRLLGLGHRPLRVRRRTSRSPGYEFHGMTTGVGTEPGGIDAMTEFFLGLQVWGTPEQCFEKIKTSGARSAATASSACSATAACRWTRPSAACGCSPPRSLPALSRVGRGKSAGPEP